MKNSRPHALAFHGFLGSENDFDPLKSEFEMTCLDLRPLKVTKDNYETYEQIATRALNTANQTILELEGLTQELTIISYSMGSKILFSILDQIVNLKSKIKFKFIFLSTHFGLYEDNKELKQELEFRNNMNIHFLNVLEVSTKEDFLNQWSKLSLFSNSKKIDTNWSMDQIRHYFKKVNQSQIKTNIAEMLSEHRVLVVFGSKDIKYQKQALRLKEKFKEKNWVIICELPGRSHRVLDPFDFKQILSVKL